MVNSCGLLLRWRDCFECKVPSSVNHIQRSQLNENLINVTKPTMYSLKISSWLFLAAFEYFHHSYYGKISSFLTIGSK